MNNKDLRVIKTKASIREALMRILAEKPMGKVTIKEISDAAGINRKTFYAHYETIDDIVSEMEDELLNEMEQYIVLCMMENYTISPFTFLQFVNNIYNSNPTFCESLTSMRNYNFFVEKVKALMKKYLMSSANFTDDEVKASLKIEFYVSGIAAVYISWLKKGKPCAFEDLADIIGAL